MIRSVFTIVLMWKTYLRLDYTHTHTVVHSCPTTLMWFTVKIPHQVDCTEIPRISILDSESLTGDEIPVPIWLTIFFPAYLRLFYQTLSFSSIIAHICAQIWCHFKEVIDPLFIQMVCLGVSGREKTTWWDNVKQQTSSAFESAPLLPPTSVWSRTNALPR